MTLLFDQNISYRITKKLQEHFSGCKHISDCGLQNCEDTEIWKYARKSNLAIVTFDSDFYDISLLYGYPPKIIWIRTGNLTTHEIATLLIKNSAIISDFLNKDEYKDVACIELEY